MNIAERLNSKGATPETILQVLQTSVFELSGDLTPDEMRQRLEVVAGDTDAVSNALRVLETDPSLIGEVSLIWIKEASEDPERQDAIEGAIAGADREMPLLETGVIALVALYAIYMLGPDKPLRAKRTLKQMSDGTFEEQEDTEYASFDTPVRGLFGIFGRIGGSGLTGRGEELPPQG